MINHGKLKAKELINNYCINSFENFRLEEIVNAEGLIILEKSLQNMLGKLIVSGDSGIIYINSEIREPGMKRFTIAHELGHFIIDKGRNNYAHIFKQKIYTSKSPTEREANSFAAELLMYKPWFSDFINNKIFEFNLLIEIANHFKVTLLAAALRYAEEGTEPIAVILSKNGRIKWFFINRYFPLKSINQIEPVKKETMAYKVMINKCNYDDKIAIEAYYWFDYSSLPKWKINMWLYEYSYYYHYYDIVLTILWEMKI